MEVSNSSTVVAMTAAAAVVVKKSTVTFDKIEIREFAPMVGDNPAVSGGVPIALGSILIQQRVLSIKHYERDRAPRRDRKERRAILLAEGFELQEISLAVQVAREARKLLAESKNNKSWDGFHAKVEATSRVFAMVTGLKRQPKSDSINQNHAKQLQLNGGNATKDNKYTTTTGMGMLPAMPMTIRKVQSSASTA